MLGSSSSSSSSEPQSSSAWQHRGFDLHHCWPPSCFCPLLLKHLLSHPLLPAGTCRVSKATGVRLVFEQQIWRLPRKHRAPAAASNGGGSGGSAAEAGEEQEELVLTAEAVVVSLDKRYKPKRISPALRERLVSGAASEGPPIPLQELL